MKPERGPQTGFLTTIILRNYVYSIPTDAIYVMQSMYNKSPLMQSMLCNLCYAIYAMQSAIYAMQSMLCNLC